MTTGPLRSFDTATHVLRLALLDHSIRHGSLYPRWLPQIMLGHGAPILNYYAPLTYYLAEVLHLGGLSLSAAVTWAMGLLIILAGWGMYLLARDVYGEGAPWAALAAAVTYMYAPYLLTNIFIRGGAAEASAQAALPWVLWSVRRLMCAARPEVYVLPVVLSLACLVLSHTVALLLVPPFLVAYVLILWRGQRWEPQRLVWLAVAIALAAGATAFFWAPVIFERNFVTQGAYDTVREVFMPRNAWRWDTFLDLRFQYNYNFGLPVRLGLVQLILCLAGVVLARRRDAEWVFFVVAAVLVGLSIGAWTLPIWLSNPILLAVQFPWRLLALLSMLMALLTGGVLLRLPRGLAQMGGALVLIGVVIVANVPHLAWMQPLPLAFGDLTVATSARYEHATGSMGGEGYFGEFTPRWVGKTKTPTVQEAVQSALEITLQDGNASSVRGVVTSPTGGVLRLTQYYFPGWQVSLDNEPSLRPYPSDGSGFLAVDLPPGTHAISIQWVGTPLERGASFLSLLALALLAGLLGLRVRPRWLCAVPLVLLTVGAGVFYRPAPVQPISLPSQPIEAAGMRLLGYRLERGAPDSLTVYPYWLVTGPCDDLRMQWTLRDQAGRLIHELTQAPYFDSANCAEWPAGTLVADGLELALPVDLPAGSYSLDLRLDAAGVSGDSQSVGSFELPRPQEPAKVRVPANAQAAQFGGGMVMAGYDLSLNGRNMPGFQAGNELLVLHPGDILQYSLYWRAAGRIEKDYRARVELVNSDGVGVSGLEQVAGGFLYEPTTWDPYRLRVDTYRVTAPDQLPAGLYSIQIRAYDPDFGQSLDVADQTGEPLGDALRLHLAKVIDVDTPRMQHSVGGKLGEDATLLGYDLSPQAEALKPGDQFTVTLYYQAKGPMSADYTRFVHLLGPGLEMAAQQDSYPQAGRNPTHTWVAGEVIADPVTLTIAPDARPGDYVLAMGFYDLPANQRRLPLRDAENRPVQDNAFILGKIRVH